VLRLFKSYSFLSDPNDDEEVIRCLDFCCLLLKINHTKTDNIDTATIEQTTPAMSGALFVFVPLFEMDD